MTAAQELDVIGRALSKSREEIALDLRDCDEEFRVGYMLLLGEIDDAVAALASLRERQQAGPQPNWEPVPLNAITYILDTIMWDNDSALGQAAAIVRSWILRRTQAGRQDGE